MRGLRRRIGTWLLRLASIVIDGNLLSLTNDEVSALLTAAVKQRWSLEAMGTPRDQLNTLMAAQHKLGDLEEAYMRSASRDR